MVAVDDDDNKTPCPQTLALKLMHSRQYPNIRAVSSAVHTGEIHLGWELPQAPVSHILVYKKMDDEGFFTYKRLSPRETHFSDADIQDGHTYQYGLVLEYESGKRSKLVKGEVLVVN